MNTVSPISNWLESRGQTPQTFLKELVLARIYLAVTMMAIMIPAFALIVHYGKVLFPPSPPGTAPSFAPNTIFFLLAISVYINSLRLIAISQISGWRKLAHRFPTPAEFREGQLFNKQKARIGICEYQALTIGVSTQGLYLNCTFPARITHPPILIPWQQIISVRQNQLFWQTTAYLVIGSPRLGTITLKNAEILEAAQPWLPTQPSI